MTTLTLLSMNVYSFEAQLFLEIVYDGSSKKSFLGIFYPSIPLMRNLLAKRLAARIWETVAVEQCSKSYRRRVSNPLRIYWRRTILLPASRYRLLLTLKYSILAKF